MISRLAGTIDTPASLFIATVVLANDGMKRLTGSVNPIVPSSTRVSTATLVIAFDCEAMRKIVSVVMRRPASLSLHPTARS